MDHAAFQAALVGQTILRLVAQEYWHEGQLVHRFNVVFASVGDHWLRFFIDASVFFCSVVATLDPPPPHGSYAWTLAEYPFAGTVQEVVFSTAPDLLSLRIVLSDGRALCLHDEADHTTVTFLPPNHALQRTEAGV